MIKKFFLIFFVIVATAVIDSHQSFPCSVALKPYFDFARNFYGNCRYRALGYLVHASFRGVALGRDVPDQSDHYFYYCRLQFSYSGGNLVADRQRCYFSNQLYTLPQPIPTRSE